MIAVAAEALLRRLCAVPELTPEFWGISEPVSNPFRQECLHEVIFGSMVPSEEAREYFTRTLAFLVRKTKPCSAVSIDLRLAPAQWGSPHNRVSIEVTDSWCGGECELARYLPQSVPPIYPDYARVFDPLREDADRLKEFRRSYTPQEFLQMLAERQKKSPELPFGPYGCLEDIYWFNYFGQVYVDFIGRARLLAAGWALIEDVGGGLACYASETIDAPNAREQRLRIASALGEFVWSPGCRIEDKKVPVFDFSEQFAALPPNALAKLR